jgi:S1-C subfamily serine protease
MEGMTSPTDGPPEPPSDDALSRSMPPLPPALAPPPPPWSGQVQAPAADQAQPLTAAAPLHPPQNSSSQPVIRPSDGLASRPSRPPIYDPSHYGYGPWRPEGNDEPVDLQPLFVEPVGWRRFRGPLTGALIGALIASVAVLVAIAFVGDGGTDTVETVFEFPDSGPSTILDGERLDIQGVLAKVSPSVVTIKTGAESVRGIFEGAGSGVVIGEGGLILTNAHVIQDADTIEVLFFDGTLKAADLVGSFPDADIVIIRARNISGLIPADLGSSADLRVGDEVVAIGNALNLGDSPSVTKGIVSAKGRTISDGVLTLDNLIQTDAAINPGNSGGPLVNAAGQVVGINTAIIDNAQSIGFAISIDVVRPLIDRALSGDADLNPDTAFLGVTTISVSSLGEVVLDEFGVTATQGAFVQEVLSGSPAQRSGVERGDVITSIDGQAIDSSEDVARTVRAMRPGDNVEVLVVRNGRTEIITVTLDVRN